MPKEEEQRDQRKSETLTSENPKEQELRSKLEALQSQLQEEQKTREEVLSDPQVKSLLEAKAKGEQVQLVMGQKEDPQPKSSLRSRVSSRSEATYEQSKLDELSHAEFADVMSDAVEEVVKEAVSEAVSAVKSETENRFGVIVDNQKKLRDAIVQQAAATGVNYMKETYSDYGEFHDETRKIMAESRLGIEDAYLLAKARAASAVPKPTAVESERTTMVARSRSHPHGADRSNGQDIIARSAGSSKARFNEILKRGVQRRFDGR